jgi:hypothetical protein
MIKCPQCGYEEKVHTTSIHNFMYEYVNDKTGKTTLRNSEEKTITIKGEVWRRKDVPKDVAKPVEVSKK